MNWLVIKKSKTKQWFSVIAPKVFNERELAQTMAIDADSIINRRISVNLIEITNDFSKYYMKFFFKIKKVDGEKAFTEFDGSECMRDYISRMVVRRVRRVDTVQKLTTKDGRKIIVKGLVVLSRKIKANIAKAVRVKVEAMVRSEVENSGFDEFIEKIISDELKNKILKEGRKIYPIRNFEVRKTEVIG